jgi:benzylsuccinate CoA-transferase BbsF subunit
MMNSAFLKGVRVVAMTQVWAGGWMGGILSDMGAEVIKIESNKKIDILRRTIETEGDLNRGPNFNGYNRGTKSCNLNLKKPEGVELFKKLVKISDVVVENLAPKGMPGFGLDYNVLKEVKPDIIMVSVPGFGSTGPDKNYISYAATVQSIGGLEASFGYPGGEPSTPSIFMADPVGGMYGVLAVCSAVYYHHKTGKGQHVELAQSEAIMSLLPEVVMEYEMTGRIRPRMGNRDEIMAPHGCYPCNGKDKWVAIAVANDEEWQALCRVMGNPEWCKDEKFVDQFSRWQNQDELNKLIAGWTKDFTHYEVMHKLQKAGVAAGASLSTEEMNHDPHVKDRGALIELNSRKVGNTLTWRSPWKSALTASNSASPYFGEYNDYVFRTLLCLSDGEIAKLISEEVIY